ncbi:protein disulfide isomerase (PDI) protein [Entomortierella chlamydospora]|uniref:protein disulfide-isomerase n=1 Tax=Entomortierella chlamydospora TaxID=101097 RepID=A0A9P6SUY3_9FUNG|nr:protein disulfide isomerase (PDI) protein [Entomortierella chlamydospora]
MKSLTSIALGALLLSQTVLGLYSSKDRVVEMTTQNFQSEVMDSNSWLNSMLPGAATAKSRFSTCKSYPYCSKLGSLISRLNAIHVGNSSSLAPQYKAAADNLHGIVKMGAIDCDNDKNKPICGQYGIQGFPTIKVFPANRSGKKGVKYPKDYQGERSAKAIVDFLVKMLPNDIKLVSSNPSSERVTNIDEFVANENEPRALLFTKKLTSSNMYKGLATDMKDRMIVAEMRTPSDEVLKKFNVESAPALVVFPKGSQEPINFSGDLKRDPISEFLNEYAEPAKNGGSGSGSSKKSSQSEPVATPVAEFNPKIDQIVDQAQLTKECLDKSQDTCVIAFLVVEPEFPESVQAHEENLELLRKVKKASYDVGKSLQVMWMDALDKRVVNFMNQFQLSSDIPGLLLVKPGRKAYAPFMGQFDFEGIQEWLSGLSNGRTRAFVYSFDVQLAESKSESAKKPKDEL